LSAPHAHTGGLVPGLSLLGVSQRERLDRMLSAGLVERGAVFVLSLAPIREQAVDRWEARRDLVWDRVDRTFSAGLAMEDLWLRLDEASLLVAVSSCPAYEAQSRCVALLRQIMAHFLGHAADESIRLSRVTSVSGESLTGEAIDLLAPTPAADEGGTRDRRRRAAAWEPPLAGRSYAAPFTDIRGRCVEMSLKVTPVWCLRRGVLSSYAIRRAFPPGQQPQNDFDQESADTETWRCMIGVVEEYRRMGGAFALHVPVHFATASSRRARINLLGLSTEVLPIMRQVLILQIEGVHDGIPQGRLHEAVSMMSPFARAVMAGVREGERLSPWIRQSGFAAVGLEAGPGGAVRAGLRGLIARTRRLTPNIVIHNVSPTPDIEARLAAVGATHFTAAL